MPRSDIFSKIKDKKIIAVIVAVVVLFVFALILMPSKKPKKANDAVSEEDKPAAKDAGEYSSRKLKKSQYTSYGRNPFSKSKATAKTTQALRLNGIMWDEKNPVAIINGSPVKVGSTVQGNTVIKIMQESVILNDGFKDFELTL